METDKKKPLLLGEKDLLMLRRFLPLLRKLATRQYGLWLIQVHEGKPARIGYLPKLTALEEENDSGHK